MIPDLISYVLLACLLVAFYCRDVDPVPPLLFGFSLAFDRAIFNLEPSWDYLFWWALALAAKDLAMVIIFSNRHETKEMPIILCFSVSCLFHQMLVLEAYNFEWIRFDHRPLLMSVVVSSVLASLVLILIEGGSNDRGRRVKCSVFHHNNNSNNLLRAQAHKARS